MSTIGAQFLHLACQAAGSPPCPSVRYATAGNPIREVHRTRAREVLGLGRMKVRRLSFSVIKPKITSVHGSCQYHTYYISKSWHGSCFIYIPIIIETSYKSFNKNLEAREQSIDLRTPRYNFSRRPCSWVSYLFGCKQRLIKIVYHFVRLTIKGGLFLYRKV